HDHVGTAAEEIGHERGQAIFVAARPSALDGEVAAFDVAQLSKTALEDVPDLGRVGAQGRHAVGSRGLCGDRDRGQEKRSDAGYGDYRPPPSRRGWLEGSGHGRRATAGPDA